MIKLAKLNESPEIFHSIQGEGKSIGKPSVFVRLSNCNLSCVWCDTPYTWDWGNSKYDKRDFMIELSIVDVVEQILSYDCKNLVLTGGEPMVQLKQLGNLLSKLKSVDGSFHVEIETNGTIVPSDELDQLINQYNVSLKLSNSMVAEDKRLIDDAIQFYAQSEKSNFKFVIDQQSDLDEVQKLVSQYSISANRVFLMPQGTTSNAIINKQKWVVELCKEHGFNFTDRLHIHIFGRKRGV